MKHIIQAYGYQQDILDASASRLVLQQISTEHPALYYVQYGEMFTDHDTQEAAMQAFTDSPDANNLIHNGNVKLSK